MSNTESSLRVPFSPETRELELTVWANHGKTYVARLVGPHPKYKVEREFVDAHSSQVSRSGKNGTRWYRLPGPGLYEVSSPDTGLYDHAAKFWFELTASGEVQLITQGEAISKAKALTISERPVVEECLECGATYNEPGHVWDGGMMCSRCKNA